MADWKSMFFRLVNLARAEKLITDEGDIVGWATNESGEHYPIHAPTGGGGSAGGGKSASGGGSSKGSSGGEKTGKPKMSALQAFKENARQFNEALIEAKKRNAAVVEYKRIDGKTERRYWNGARYEDRPSPLYQQTSGKYKTKGTYKAEFKMPE